MRRADMTDFGWRVYQLLDRTFLGEYNAPLTRRPTYTEEQHVDFGSDVTPAGFSTFDFDVLTRLVIAAHELCLRVALFPSGRRFKWVVSDRKRFEPGMSSATWHPTIEQSIAAYRSNELPSAHVNRLAQTPSVFTDPRLQELVNLVRWIETNVDLKPNDSVVADPRAITGRNICARILERIAELTETK